MQSTERPLHPIVHEQRDQRDHAVLVALQVARDMTDDLVRIASLVRTTDGTATHPGARARQLGRELAGRLQALRRALETL